MQEKELRISRKDTFDIIPRPEFSCMHECGYTSNDVLDIFRHEESHRTIFKLNWTKNSSKFSFSDLEF